MFLNWHLSHVSLTTIFKLGIFDRNRIEVMLISCCPQSHGHGCHCTIIAGIRSSCLIEVVSAKLFHHKVTLFPCSEYFVKGCLETKVNTLFLTELTVYSFICLSSCPRGLLSYPVGYNLLISFYYFDVKKCFFFSRFGPLR